MSAPIVMIARDSDRAWLLAFLGWSAFVVAVTVMAPAPLVALAIVWATPTAAAAACDASHGRLPDIVVLPGAAAVFAIAVLAERWAMALIGAVLLAGPMLIVHLARPEGFGFGDVKFGLLLGVGLGAVAVPLGLLAYIAAALLHAAACVALRCRERLLPFGPALAVASAATMTLGLWRLT